MAAGCILKNIEYDDEVKDLECSICLLLLRDTVELPCGHLFCKKCLGEWKTSVTQRGSKLLCPNCKKTFKMKETHRSVFIDRMIRNKKNSNKSDDYKGSGKKESIVVDSMNSLIAKLDYHSKITDQRVDNAEAKIEELRKDIVRKECSIGEIKHSLKKLKSEMKSEFQRNDQTQTKIKRIDPNNKKNYVTENSMAEMKSCVKKLQKKIEFAFHKIDQIEKNQKKNSIKFDDTKREDLFFRNLRNIDKEDRLARLEERLENIRLERNIYDYFHVVVMTVMVTLMCSVSGLIDHVLRWLLSARR